MMASFLLQFINMILKGYHKILHGNNKFYYSQQIYFSTLISNYINLCLNMTKNYEKYFNYLH